MTVGMLPRLYSWADRRADSTKKKVAGEKQVRRRGPECQRVSERSKSLWRDSVPLDYNMRSHNLCVSTMILLWGVYYYYVSS